MKTKSKLVLGLSILSAATLAAGATSTFAWFTATTSVKTAADSKGISVTSAGVSLGDATIEFKFGTPTAPAELSDADGVTYYYYEDANAARPKTVDVSAQIGSVGWTIAWKAGTTSDAKVAAATQTATFTVEKVQDRIYFLQDNSAIQNNAMSENFTVTVTVQADGSLSGDQSGTLYFRVDGGASTGTIQNDENGPLTGQTIVATGNHDA